MEKQGKTIPMRADRALLRILIIGGGGCGKSRIINQVLTGLFIVFWGPRGCVKLGPTNKAARNIDGKTMHAGSKLRPDSLKMFALRTNAQVQTALSHLYVPCGGLIIDEVPQGAGELYHAVALRCSYGRATPHNLNLEDYAEPSQTFGAIPIVVECGDELQLPPVPESKGLFADLTNAAPEHAAGVQIFRQKDYVYRLQTMMRFTDPVLISILAKIRTLGGCKLTNQEWQALKNTELTTLSATEQQERLKGTELYYHSALTWASVSMAQAIRSRMSAERSEAILYLIPAEDYVLDRPYHASQALIAEEIKRQPNMNSTGRLPSIAMLHNGMEVRLTEQVEPPHAVNDSTGIILGIDLHPEDASTAAAHAPTQLLRHLPEAILVKLHNVSAEFLPPIPCTQHTVTGARRDCNDCDFRPGCIAIEPRWSRRSFKVEVTRPNGDMYVVRVQANSCL